MISFRSTEEELAFVEVAKNLAKEKIRPQARICERNQKLNEEIVQEVQELGFLSLELSEDWDGLELPLISQVQILQGLCYGDLDVVQGLPGAGDAASFIRFLNQRLDTYKTDIVDELQTVSYLDLSEDWGTNIEVKKEMNHYILNGMSQPVKLAAQADYVLIAVMDSNGEPILFWLDSSVHPWHVEEGDYRLGLLTSGIARFTFDHVKISTDAILAQGNTAEKIIQDGRTRVRILQAAREVGLMEAALDYATEYTASRKAFGQEIAKFQGVSFRIAKMAIETRIVNHLVWEAALQADQEHPEAEGLSLRALHRAHKSLRYVTDSAVQLLGGHGYIQEFPVEKWMRDAQAQVTLYGRERQCLKKRGEQIIAGNREEVMA
ncbi:acyl-CoA dehydrogenase family protein [Salinibacillus xinjiangensis]|uniref:Acyl-CoA dehydrogenase n=1 Tax=Salinibacillus xinjiangensis TaxID=1229268 RepID=A0A6G1X6G9_9BACI|nr:acyl-CoA dehydrogenase family protein [Salinibacillus xinjiangensis]MRG86532.1 acyl-CoA dehydrogenase [Salinibacillus xinjiangensis]